MIPDLKQLIEQLSKVSPRTRAVAALILVAVVAVAALGGVVASRPHFELLYSSLEDAESASIQKALAEAGVRYRVSQPPGPYVIHVDESEYYKAQNAVAASGALIRPPAGIQGGDGGASSVFMSAGERAQNAMKREWQEMERQLEALDFVSDAVVTTSMPASSPLGKPRQTTASVMLRLRGGVDLSQEQARTVAGLVRFRFNVAPEGLMISDHAGSSLWDPARDDGKQDDPGTLIDSAARYDREVASKANEALSMAFGHGQAYVTVTSEWDYDRSTSIEETPTKGVAVSEESSKSETPQGGTSATGPAGLAGNLPDGSFGIDNAGFVAGSTGTQSGGVATSEDKKKRFETGLSTTHRVHTAPRLQRLSVSLFLDESLAERQEELESVVRAAVGFVEDEVRTDLIRSIVTPLARVRSESETTEGGPVEALPEAVNPMVELLLERGVEIVAAAAFLFLLLRSLKGSRRAGRAAAAGGPSNEAVFDHERLVQAQVEELVRSEPERVSEILGRWAAEEGALSEVSR